MRNIRLFIFIILFFILIKYLAIADNEKEVTIATIPVPSIINVGFGILEMDAQGEWTGYVLISNIRTFDFEDYIARVLQAEIGEFRETNNADVRMAQAVVARSYAIKNIKTREWAHIDAITREQVDIDICGTIHHQVCSTIEPEQVFKDAANDTAGQVIKYDGSIIDATFFSHAGDDQPVHYTRNSEDWTGFYHAYLRKTITPEEDIENPPDKPDFDGGHSVGMSQYGAKILDEQGLSYENILKHYYGPVPPYVRKVKVSQKDLEYYDVSWIDDDIINDDYLHPTRHFAIETNKPLDVEADAIIEIYFSEEISGIDGIRVTIENEEAFYIGWTLSDNPPLGVTKFELASQQLKNIGSGKHTIKIKAKHKFAQDWQLDSNPKTFAYQSIDPDNLNNFIGYEPGEDTSHQISISSTSSGIYTMDFEDGIDGNVIRSSIPGLFFTTTQGYDWIYAGIRTGKYNVRPYNDGVYECNGDFFAWLGENQGMGRIDFTGATTKSVSFAYSSKEIMYLEAYDSNGKLVDSDSGPGNLSTGRLDRLSITGTKISYVLVHDEGNFWLVDDLIVEDLLRDTTAKFLPQDFERSVEILDTINIGLPQETEFTNSTPQIMKIILNWGGSEMKLEAYKPDGTHYGQWQSANPPIVVDIPNAGTGKWKFVTTAINIPHNDYPFALVVGTKQAPSYTISFDSGWNLISVPVQLPDNALVNVFQPIADYYQSIWTYENNEWKWYIENAPPSFNDLKIIESGKGYWINMKNESTLTFMGDQITNTAIPLFTGWNLVGFNSLMEESVEKALLSIVNSCQSVYAYDSEWKQYTVNSGNNSLKKMEPGKGYWINTKADCVWDINKTIQPPPMILESTDNYALSGIPEIPFVIWGNVDLDGVRITNGKVLLIVDNKIQSAYQLGSVERYEDFYVLEIPVIDNSKQAELYVQIDDNMMKAIQMPTGVPGQLIKLDLSVRQIPVFSMLHQNYPNPFNSGTWIPYQLKADSDVLIRIYTITGQLVRTLNLGYKLADFYVNKDKAVYWDGKNETNERAARGVYFYNIRAGDLTTTKKMVITNSK